MCKKRVGNIAQHFTLHRAPISHRALMEQRRNFSASPKFLPFRRLLSAQSLFRRESCCEGAFDFCLSHIRRQSAARKSSRMCISTGCFSWEKGHICFSLWLSGSLSFQSGKNGSTQCSLCHHHLCEEINILSRTAFNDLREFSLECPWRRKIISCQQQKWMGWSDTHFSISSACVVQLTE